MYRFDILRNPVPRSLFSGSHPVHSFVAFPHGLCHIRIFLHAYVYQADLIVFPVKTAQAALIVELEIMGSQEIRICQSLLHIISVSAASLLLCGNTADTMGCQPFIQRPLMEFSHHNRLIQPA